jgi:hypothetical protein
MGRRQIVDREMPDIQYLASRLSIDGQGHGIWNNPHKGSQQNKSRWVQKPLQIPQNIR